MSDDPTPAQAALLATIKALTEENARLIADRNRLGWSCVGGHIRFRADQVAFVTDAQTMLAILDPAIALQGLLVLRAYLESEAGQAGFGSRLSFEQAHLHVSDLIRQYQNLT